MTRNKDTESRHRMAAEQELKVAEKAGEHQVKIGTMIEVEKEKAAGLKNSVKTVGVTRKTTEGTANSCRSLKKPGQLQR